MLITVLQIRKQILTLEYQLYHSKTPWFPVAQYTPVVWAKLLRPMPNCMHILIEKFLDRNTEYDRILPGVVISGYFICDDDKDPFERGKQKEEKNTKKAE